MIRIQNFDSINESHAATGYHGRTDLPHFHIFTLEDTYPGTRQVMPPYTFNFYQIVFMENSDDARLNMNTAEVGSLSDSLTFASPRHVLAWVRGAAQQGFVLYFKEEFLAHHPAAVLDEFPFFRLTEINRVPIEASDKTGLMQQFSQLLHTFHSPHPYRVPILQAQLLVLLYECKRLYDSQEKSTVGESRKSVLASRFIQFIQQHFLVKKSVKDYAELLHVSPDYLGQCVREVTGKTPLNLIEERVVLEAKKLLRYSDLTIAEIADYLSYAEPTHFSRFFRRATGVSPLVWRQQHD